MSVNLLNACAVLLLSYSYYSNVSYSFRDEGHLSPLLHIAANDDAKSPYNLKENFEEACDFISKLHLFILVT